MVYGDKTFEWEQGRLLSKVQTGNEEVSLFYDHNGLRTNKIVYNGLETRTESYKYDGNKLVSMRSMKNALHDTYDRKFVFVYNSNGIIGFILDGNYYYYAKNEFGDVVAIVDKLGNTVAKYFYDAWGNALVEDGNRNPITDTSHIAYLNPIRYRGYFYDEDLGLYYLQSRYYDPQTGRFINADTLDYLDPESINGLNLYAYCYNNPINYVDPTGHMPFFILTAIIGAIIGVAITAAVDYIPDKEFNLHWGWYVGAGVIGALVGAGIGMAVSYYATGSIASSTGKVFSGLFGKTTFYRTMSADDYATLQVRGKLPAGTETFISPSSSYASTYNGVTVKFTIRKRTFNWLTKIGVKDGSTLVGSMYSSMPMVSKGWMATNAFFKAEQGIINIGLGYGRALAIFNKGIVMFGLL